VKPYKAVLFDLFSTVALWRPDRVPLFEWRGKSSRSTMGNLRQTIEAELPDITFAAFVDGLALANEQLAARRAAEHREFSSLQRFTLALTNAGSPDSDETRRIATLLSLKHMDMLAAAVDIPPAHTAFLARMAAEYPLALVSNFDHGETARAILARDGAATFFDRIVISDEYGWRKPYPGIFTDTLAMLGIAPQDALYVGDSVADDVVGAKGAGLDVAWVNATDSALPASVPNADFVVRAIPELADVLLK
jgi:FMN phosphatase YigB (HAD superfamily)|tara:strand:- start:575 stop:1324 length:750 start_codon:yes stop_codon:yes gene_type:complete